MKNFIIRCGIAGILLGVVCRGAGAGGGGDVVPLEQLCSIKNNPVELTWAGADVVPIVGPQMAATLQVKALVPIRRLRVQVMENTALGVTGAVIDYVPLSRGDFWAMPIALTAPVTGGEGTIKLAVQVETATVWEQAVELNVIARPEGNYLSPYGLAELEAARLFKLAEADSRYRAGYEYAAAELSKGSRTIDFSPGATEALGAPQKPTESLTIRGRYQWRDIAKGSDAKHARGTGGLYPTPGLRVEAYDKADAAKRVLGSATTTSDGSYSLSIARDAADTTTNPLTLVLRIQASAQKFEIRTTALTGSALYSYEVEVTGLTDQKSLDAQASKLQVVFEGEVGDAATRQKNRVWGVYSAMYFLQTFLLKTSAISSTPSWTVRFPGSSLTSSYYLASELHLMVEDYADFDVVMHEFGHFLQDKQVLLTSQAGGSHSSADDLISTNGKDEGSRLAWSEGMATALGFLMEVEGGATTAMAPRFGDLNYDDFEDGALSISVETDEGYNPASEGNEGVVTRILFDYADNLNSAEGFDVSTKGFATLIAQLKLARASRLDGFWKTITGSGLSPNSATTSVTAISQIVLNEIAPIFAYNGVAPLPLSPKGAKDLPATGDTITFRWKGNINTVYAQQSYRVLFLDTTGRVVASSAVFTRTGAEVSASVPRTVLATARAAVGATGTLLWTVAGIDSASPATGVYVGPPLSLEDSASVLFVIDDTGSMTEEIAGVRQGLLNVIARLASSGEASSYQLITFKDNVTVRAPTSDLKVIQSQVSGLVASGGGDAPESSVEALWEAARIIKTSGSGGTVFLATDAPPHAGLSIPATISALRSAGARVNVILTQDGSSKPGDPSSQGEGDGPGKGDGDTTSYVSPLTPSELAKLIPDAAFSGSTDAFGDIASGSGGTLLSLSKYDSARIIAAVENLTVSGLRGGIVQVLPRTAPAGARLQVVIQGQKTNFDSRTTVAFSRGITVNSLTVTSPIELVADVSVAATATAGDVSVTAVTGAESVQGVNIFQIAAPSTTARLLSVVPSVIPRGALSVVRIRGYNTSFSGTPAVTFLGGGISVKSSRVISTSEVEATIETTLTADRTFRTVLVGSLFLDESIRVASSDVATVGVVTAITPAEMTAGTSATVTLSGSGVAWNGTSVVSISGAGVTAEAITLISPTEIRVRLTAAAGATAGFRDVFVRTGETTVSGLQLLKIVLPTSRLINLSTRGAVLAGGALTPGFVLKGPGAKQLLIRGIGPTLTTFGISGSLPDPKLELFAQGVAASLTGNDNWGGASTLASAAVAVGAFPLSATSKDAVVLASLTTAGLNSFSARLTSSVADQSGLALTEIYDTEPVTSPVRLVNISTLGFAGTGESVLTAGFVVGGVGGKQLLIRAVGPGLAAFGVSNLMADPQVSVIAAGQSTPLASNNDWGGTAALKAAFASVGAFQLGDTSRDGAVVVTLQPGAYSVVVSGVGGTVGNVLVEIYDLDP